MKRIAVSQQVETETHPEVHEDWNCRYGYARSAESRARGDVGQDYLCMAADQDKLVFVLCDGVGLSYFGDWAARFLGDHLCEWLCEELEDACPAVSLPSRLNRFLEQITAAARECLRRHEIPSSIQGILREVLMSKKAQGSAAIYGCGRIDLPGDRFPEGRIVLAGQGDVRIRIWAGRDERTDDWGRRLHSRQQWNSITGPVGGLPDVYSESLARWGTGGEVLLYSDGLRALDSIDRVTPERLSETLRRESSHPSSDDMSWFHARWDLPGGGR